MKIVIVGALENRVEALESSYARAFSHLGHSVFRWDPMQALARNSRGRSLGAIFSRFVHIDVWLRKANSELLSFVTEVQPDLLLVIGTSGIRAGTLGQIRVQSSHTALICLYPDSPHNLDHDRILSLPLFDRVLVSSPAWVRTFRKLGSEHVDFLPFASDSLIHSPITTNYGKKYQIGFVGTWRPDREIFLEQLCHLDLAIWGSSYWGSRTRRGSTLRQKWTGKSLPFDKFPQACADTKIMINLIDGHTWPGPNMRCFELAGCGAFQLVTRTPAVTEIFQEGVNIECFDTIEEAQSKIDYYLLNSECREKIAEAARQFVLDHKHTYIDRAALIISWVESYSK